MKRKRRIKVSSVFLLIFTALFTIAVIGALFFGYFYYKRYLSPGWHEKDGKTYYITDKDGKNAVGLYSIDGITYLFDKEGTMLTGWQNYKGSTYYFADDGIMQKGVVNIDGTDYNLSSDTGKFYTGTIEINGSKVYFNKYGFTDSGFITVDGVTRFYNSAGELVTG